MNSLDRRHLLKAAEGASAAVAAGRWLESPAAAADPPKPPIKIGQIGTGHEHASAKMRTFRKLSDHYEVVGIAEPDAALRKSRENDPAYRDLRWMTEEELLDVQGLRAVAVSSGARVASTTVPIGGLWIPTELKQQHGASGRKRHAAHQKRRRGSRGPATEPPNARCSGPFVSS